MTVGRLQLSFPDPPSAPTLKTLALPLDTARYLCRLFRARYAFRVASHCMA